jgi:hypothetical protein
MDVRLEVAEHVRCAGGADGAVLLDLRSGKYFALNAVGGLLWETVAAGASRGEAVQRLAERFPEVSLERLDHDAGALLGQLQARGLLRPWTGAERGAGPAPPAVPAPGSRPVPSSEASSRTDEESSSVIPSAARDLGGGASSERAAHSPDSSPRLRSGQALWALAGYLGLLLSDAALHLLGFSRFYALVRRFPTRSPARSRPARAGRIVAGVDRAAAFYFKRAWCLQRSALTVVLLRLAGLPARLVIAVQRVPFGAHAWVELDGRVVNDRPAVRRDYEVLETC